MREVFLRGVVVADVVVIAAAGGRHGGGGHTAVPWGQSLSQLSVCVQLEKHSLCTQGKLPRVADGRRTFSDGVVPVAKLCQLIRHGGLGERQVGRVAVVDDAGGSAEVVRPAPALEGRAGRGAELVDVYAQK